MFSCMPTVYEKYFEHNRNNYKICISKCLLVGVKIWNTKKKNTGVKYEYTMFIHIECFQYNQQQPSRNHVQPSHH